MLGAGSPIILTRVQGRYNMRKTLTAILVLAASPALAANYGVFRNPSGNVEVKLADCGKQLCGTIVKASAILNGKILSVKGCLLGDKLCKSQDWMRVR